MGQNNPDRTPLGTSKEGGRLVVQRETIDLSHRLTDTTRNQERTRQQRKNQRRNHRQKVCRKRNRLPGILGPTTNQATTNGERRDTNRKRTGPDRREPRDLPREFSTKGRPIIFPDD
jgi:hypothetical protein